MPSRPTPKNTLRAKRNATSIMVGISSCLHGQPVRYDGRHKFNALIVNSVGQIFQLIPICPERAIGMGIPRSPIRLTATANGIRALGVFDPNLDVTEKLTAYGRSIALDWQNLSAYIFKKHSPSCGTHGVGIHTANGTRIRHGAGLFARQIIAQHKLLPIADEAYLSNTHHRANFVLRTYLYHDWQKLHRQPITIKALLAFHHRHEFIAEYLQHKPYQALRQLIARRRCSNISALARLYGSCLMASTKKIKFLSFNDLKYIFAMAR